VLLGLPAHLAPQAMARSLARAQHALAAVLLASVAVLLVAIQVATPSLLLWPAFVALLPVGGLLVAVARTHALLAVVAYLAVGGACLYWYAVTLFSQVSAVDASDAFTLSLPKIALVMVGGAGPLRRHGLVWSAAGFLVGELATLAATVQTGQAARVDVTTLLAFGLVAVVTVHGDLVRDRVRRRQPTLHRAARDEQADRVRHDLELQAAALVHDTVLGDLAAVASSEPGPLRPALVEAVTRDLESLVGHEWAEGAGVASASATPGRGGDVPGTEPAVSLLDAPVAAARASGLDVRLTGDAPGLALLPPATAAALSGAVGQCLVNVARHSGADQAEIVVYGDAEGVTVMVVDDGVGFDPRAPRPGRLGLDGSVVGRVERVGGTAQVFSAPGSGTSVVLTVPVPAEAGAGTPSTGAPTSGGARSTPREPSP